MAGSRGPELQRSRAPASPLLTNQTTAPYTASQHAVLFPMISKGSRVEQEGRVGEWVAERAKMQMLSAPSAKCPFHLKPPFTGCKAAPSGWSPTSCPSEKEHDWLQLTTPSPCSHSNNSSTCFHRVVFPLSRSKIHKRTNAGSIG